MVNNATILICQHWQISLLTFGRGQGNNSHYPTTCNYSYNAKLKENKEYERRMVRTDFYVRYQLHRFRERGKQIGGQKVKIGKKRRLASIKRGLLNSALEAYSKKGHLYFYFKSI
jgi:hypothetical protein